MLQQFRRALGVTVVRGMAKHKLSRLHYVRGTAEEAKYTAEANHNNNRWKAGQRGSSWYSSHTPPGYATYEQFRWEPLRHTLEVCTVRGFVWV